MRGFQRASMQILGVAVVGLIGVLVALFLTSHGVLIDSELVQSHQPQGQAHLECSYFTGSSIVTTEFWYSPNGFMGRALCPRLHDFKE